MSWREDLAIGKLKLVQLMSQSPNYGRYKASGEIDKTKSFNILDGSSAAANMTLTPEDGSIYLFACVDSTSAVKITLQGSWTFDGTHAIATFTKGKGMVVIADAENNMAIVLGNNGVVLS